MGHRTPTGAARRADARRLHAPPLAEEAAAGARRAGPAWRSPARPAARCSRWRRATTSNRGWCPRGRALVAAHGPLARRALPPLATRGWTLLVQGVDLHDEARASPAAALSLRARRAARRRHGLVCQRRRRRRPAHRFLRRLPAAACRAAGAGASAGWCDAAARRRAAEDARRLQAAPRTGCSSPATCSTCRRAGATTASPSATCLTASIGFRAPVAGELAADAAAAAGRRDADATTTRPRLCGDAIATAAQRRPIAGAHPRPCSASPRDAVERLAADPIARAAGARRSPERAQAGNLVRAPRRGAALPAASSSTGRAACSTTTPTSSSTARRFAPAAAMPH